MSIGERIKKLRKSQGLTLDRFGERVGVSKVAISKLENGINNMTDQMALSICREFGIREEWLRNGTGEMYVEQSADEYIQQWVDRVLAGRPADIKRRLLSSLPRISSAGWEAIELLLKEAERIMEEDENTDPDEDSIEDQVEEYRRQLLAEKEVAAELGVSGITG